MDFATIVDEVVEQFKSKLDVDISISIEIQARADGGFDKAMRRSIKENCNVLRSNNAEFEEGEGRWSALDACGIAWEHQLTGNPA